MEVTAEDIRRMNRVELLGQYDQLTPDKTPEAWLRGQLFEYLVIRAFELDGAQVQWPYDVLHGGHLLEQVDGAVHVDHIAALVESKCWAREVDWDPIAKLRSKLLNRPSSAIGLVFSKMEYTPAAKVLTRFAFPQTILLWEGEELRWAIENGRMCEGLHLKYRYAVEQFLPDFDMRKEEWTWPS